MKFEHFCLSRFPHHGMPSATVRIDVENTLPPARQACQHMLQCSPGLYANARSHSGCALCSAASTPERPGYPAASCAPLVSTYCAPFVCANSHWQQGRDCTEAVLCVGAPSIGFCLLRPSLRLSVRVSTNPPFLCSFFLSFCLFCPYLLFSYFFLHFFPVAFFYFYLTTLNHACTSTCAIERRNVSELVSSAFWFLRFRISALKITSSNSTKLHLRNPQSTLLGDRFPKL